VFTLSAVLAGLAALASLLRGNRAGRPAGTPADPVKHKV
jgi:hypothetical protein